MVLPIPGNKIINKYDHVNNSFSKVRIKVECGNQCNPLKKVTKSTSWVHMQYHNVIYLHVTYSDLKFVHLNIILTHSNK